MIKPTKNNSAPREPTVVDVYELLPDRYDPAREDNAESDRPADRRE